MNVVVVKYNAGNTQSVLNALAKLPCNAILSDDPALIRNADKVIFPGVGHASSAMADLAKTGLDEVIKNLNQPVLGICLGMQLMCSFSEEGNTEGMGIFRDRVLLFDKGQVKVPHMGWNPIKCKDSALFSGMDEAFMYHVHSYYVPDNPQSIASTQYGNTVFSSAMQQNNFYAVQFHPEKSGAEGSKILKNFITLCK